MSEYSSDILRATESAAIESSKWLGLGDESGLAQAAASNLHLALKSLEIEGNIRIGDPGSPICDGMKIGDPNRASIAVRSVEGITATSLGGTNSLSLIAVSHGGIFPAVPAVYMNKLVVPPWAAGAVDLDLPVPELLDALAAAKGVHTDGLRVVILDRPRNQPVIDQVRSKGGRVTLIADGDVAVSIAILAGTGNADCLLGSGGAREAVFTAAAARAVGDTFRGSFLIRTRDEENLLLQADLGGIDIRKPLTAQNLAPGHVTLGATAITDCPPYDGVRIESDRVTTTSLLFRGDTGTIRTIHSTHKLPGEKAPIFIPDQTL